MIQNLFKVSVIIPVYNAEKYVTEAVESALKQPETGEVLLIEDNSPDNSLAVCQQLASKYEKVKLFQHPDQGNHGAGASRNVGLLNAQYPYICFLDADDYMLPDRFKPAAKVFAENPEADGVYDAVGIDFTNDEAKEKWLKWKGYSITTIKKVLPPEEVFYCQALGRNGYFHTNGIVLKSNVFKEIGFFDTELKLSQDNHMFIRIAAIYKLYPGSIVIPVAIRRVHGENRVLRSKDDVKFYSIILWEKLYFWSIDAKIKKSFKQVLFNNYYISSRSNGVSIGSIIRRNIFITIFWKFLITRLKNRLIS